MDLHKDLDEGVEAVLEELSAVILLKAQWSQLLYDHVNNQEPDSFFVLLVDFF